MTCALFEPLLPELALGVLSGEERARVIAHVEGCRPCSAAVAELSAAADELLHLAPATEPPVGFELRLLQRIRSGRRRRRARRPLALVAAAAAVVLFAGGVLAGHALSPGGPGPVPRGAGSGRAAVGGAAWADSDLLASPLVASGHAVGQVMVYAGNPTWVFMYMDDPSWHGPLRCQVVEQGEPARTLGEFWLSAGKGAWAASVQEPAGRLSEARVVDARGTVLAVAHLN
jgi:hypothetical protein